MVIESRKNRDVPAIDEIPFDKDRLVADIDHQVNVKAEVKTSLIMSRLDDLERQMHYLHAEQMKAVKSAA